MIVFPNCKINLGLNIVGKRDDGFHDLQTIFYPVKFHDALEILNEVEDQPKTIDHGRKNFIQFKQTGIDIPGNKEDNLCVKAYLLLKKDIPQLPPVYIHIHKSVPLGAGLGGGSSDGAFTLKVLNDQYQLGLSNNDLINYAAKLGSDCPFFIINTACYATGRGEQLKPINLDLSNYSFILINPGININTAWAFSQLMPKTPSYNITTIIHQPLNTWKETMTNDFENVVFANYPQVKAIKEELYKHGALYASMTGSGSTVFGIFEKNKIPKFRFPDNLFVKIIR